MGDVASKVVENSAKEFLKEINKKYIPNNESNEREEEEEEEEEDYNKSSQFYKQGNNTHNYFPNSGRFGYAPQPGYSYQKNVQNNFQTRNHSSLHRHPLVYRCRLAFGDFDWICDICGARFHNKPSYCCIDCNFDVCSNCYNNY